jgi:hypothetical protein
MKRCPAVIATAGHFLCPEVFLCLVVSRAGALSMTGMATCMSIGGMMSGDRRHQQ